VPALPSSILEPLWVQVAALLPARQDAHPVGCHRPTSPTGLSSTSSSNSWCLAAATAASPTRPARRPPCAAAATSGSTPASLTDGTRLALAAYDRMHGLELEHLAVDGRITKAPYGGQVAGPSQVDRRNQGLKRSVATEAHGVPLAAVPVPANRRDDGLLAAADRSSAPMPGPTSTASSAGAPSADRPWSSPGCCWPWR
jgi:hypothetical protein